MSFKDSLKNESGLLLGLTKTEKTVALIEAHAAIDMQEFRLEKLNQEIDEALSVKIRESIRKEEMDL